jgi:hypothetical protein
MAYEFLKDGSPFNALSLTTRFDTLVTDVNAVSADAIQFLGLGPEQLPSFIGGTSVTETFTSENTASTVVTPSTSGTDDAGSPVAVNGREYGGAPTAFGDRYYVPPSSVDGFETKLEGNYTLARTDVQDVTALLVMANVEVRQFSGVEVVTKNEANVYYRYWGITLNEYEWDATVILELQDSNGVRGYLPRTERQVSPRVTIGAAGNKFKPDPPGFVFAGDDVPGADTDGDGLSDETKAAADFRDGRVAMSPLRDYPGHSSDVGEDFYPVVQQFDHRTHQDVSIRTVITADDLSRLEDDTGAPVTIANVRYVRLAFASLNFREYSVQRANVTVMPMLAKVEVA